jgi:hypothetical protein
MPTGCGEVRSVAGQPAVVSLLIGGIVVLGAVFVLGVLVGKKLAGTPRTDRAPDLPPRSITNRTHWSAPGRAAAHLQEELTRPTPSAPTVTRARRRPPPRCRPCSGSLAPAGATASVPATGAPSTGSTIAAASKPAPPPRADAVPTATVAAADSGSERRPSRRRSRNRRPRPRRAGPDPVGARRRPRQSQNSGGDQPSGPSPCNSGRAQPGRRRAPGKSLAREGYAPYIVPADVPGKGTWYRVRMGASPPRTPPPATCRTSSARRRPRRSSHRPGEQGSDDPDTTGGQPWGYELIWAHTDRYGGKLLHIAQATSSAPVPPEEGRDDPPPERTAALRGGRGNGLVERELKPGEATT